MFNTTFTTYYILQNCCADSESFDKIINAQIKKNKATKLKPFNAIRVLILDWREVSVQISYKSKRVD